MHSHVTAAVAEAASALRSVRDDQPVWRRRDLVDFGIPDSLQSAMLRRDALVRLRHGVYALAELVRVDDPVARHRIDVAAAVAAAEEPVWGFAPSSSLLQGLPLPYPAPDRVHLLREGRADLRALTRQSRHRLVIPEVAVTSSTQVGDADITIVHGVPVVTRELAAVSTAGSLTSTRWRVALFDAVLWKGRTDTQALMALAERWRHLGGLEQVRAAIGLARPGAQTPLETFSRLALVEEGLPEPELQAEFRDEAGLIGYVDMWWPELGVIGEADGALKYGGGADVLAEKVREDRLRALGFIVVRWTWEEIRTNPGAVAARIRQAARLAARSRG
jgi:hypothetical protein